MNIFKLAYKNLIRRKSQSFVVFSITTITIFTLVMFFLMSSSLIEGANLSKERFGADIIVVPKTSTLEANELIFTGKPESVYMPEDYVHKISEIDEIDALTTQFYTATIEGASCCGPGESLKLVGIDFDTDFILKPWFEENQIDILKDDEVVLGSDIPMFLGNKVALLGEIFTIKNSLYNTGSGIDETIFLNLDKARQLSKDKFYETEWRNKEPEDYISCILINVDNKENIDKVVDKIEYLDLDIKVHAVSKSILNIKEQLNHIFKIIFYIILIFLSLSIISLIALYSNVIKSRSKEIGFLKSLGFTRFYISCSILLEVIIIALISALLSSIANTFIGPKVLKYIGDVFAIPITNKVNIVSKILIVSITSSLIVSIISSLPTILKITNLDIKDSINRGGISE